MTSASSVPEAEPTSTACVSVSPAARCAARWKQFQLESMSGNGLASIRAQYSDAHPSVKMVFAELSLRIDAVFRRIGGVFRKRQAES